MHAARKRTVRDHDDACDHDADLVKVKPTRGHPKLGIDGLGDNKVECALANLFRDLNQAKKEPSCDGVKDGDCARERDCRTLIPSADGRRVVKDDFYTDQEKERPDRRVKQFGDEVGPKLQLSSQ